ncbi:hypothetical protein PENSTE_c003G05838 [Penicillium steckii]|uniref:C2H2-type domain-containing protein n=1 Tax=Penicillium steckii TaxID=303698 RepID=A0A1V6TQJ3_9EURO|nr:hypothetical protein PENSTE_c003G05838 [Penicillium steckii]
MSDEDTSQQGLSSQESVSQRFKYRCTICSKQYKRREHLSRHMTSSHTSDRPFQCTICQGSFQRGDVLKRHIRTCGGTASKAGAKRRACDRCAHHKKACSAEQPCRGCSKKGALCFYSTPNSDRTAPPFDSAPTTTLSEQGHPAPSSSSTSYDPTGHELGNSRSFPTNGLNRKNTLDFASLDWPDYAQLASEAQFLDQLNCAYSLPFLERFTRNTGLASSFDCGTQEQREEVASALEPENVDPIQHSPNNHLQADLTALPISPLLFEGFSDIGADQPIPQSWFSDPLSIKTHEILLLVEEVVTIKPRNSPVTLQWSPALKNACLQFFSPINLRKYLGFYWALWHPNVNFVHKPSFDAVSAKPALLAAMALIGASVSPNMPDNEDARMWLNCVEEIVFIDDDFNSDLNYPASNNMTIHRPKLQALQAAYIVCLYQNWEGSDSSKSRIRRFRFANLVSTARDIGITTATHLNYSMLVRADFQWKEFAAREELIRLFTWIFLLDTAFVIFNNLPPRMVFKEMNIHMAAPEACFQAETADFCHQMIQLYLPPESKYWEMSFRKTFEALSQPEIPPCLQYSVSSLGLLNLFALASAIHSQIFQYHNSISKCQNLTAIRNALNNWHRAWQVFPSTSWSGISPHILVEENDINPSNMWKRNGFYRFCAEYWLLANLMADRLSLHEVLPQDSPSLLSESILDPILSKYDQTSMRQVNDLIMGFQTFQI